VTGSRANPPESSAPALHRDTEQEPVGTRRRYDSPLRRQRAAETRDRIVTAGSELLHGLPIWNWSALTVRAVAKRAATNERTVYRYFATERELRDAVMQRLEAEAGVKLDGLRLEDVADAAARIFEYASSFPFAPRTARDPTVAAANQRQREALLAAVRPWTDGWIDVDDVIAAAILDMLWSVVSFEHLVVDWEIDPKEAIRGITWVIDLVEDAIRQRGGPGS
jgi:AcrR family transcriptional regulator